MNEKSLPSESNRIWTDEEIESHRLQDWEHYHRFFKETKHFYYYVHSRGYVEKYPKEKYADNGPLSWEFQKVNTQLYKRNKKNKHEEYLSVIVDHRRYPVKLLVAQTFSRIWKPGSRIMHINGKISDCNFTNLLIIPPGSKLKPTHRGKRIQVLLDRKWINFDTLKEAAVYLNISLSSFRRYLKDEKKIKSKDKKKFIRYRYF